MVQDAKRTPHSAFDGAEFGVPDGREEEWRYAPLRRLRGLHAGDVTADGKVLVEVSAAEGVLVETIARDDSRIGRTGPYNDKVAATAYAGFGHATLVSVPRDAQIEGATMLTLRGEGAESAAFGHVVIELGAFAKATVVLDHQGSATYAGNVEVVVGEGASLTLVSVQDWADDTVHLGHQHLQLARDASIRGVTVTFGGSVVRMFPQVQYLGPGGDAELLGLYFADAGQYLEHRLFVDHSVPNCRSNVAYKGALQGADSHTVWVGDVLIRAEAVGTDTYEINRNLILTDGARADSVPNLEIETGEIVGAGHASTTGRFDDEQLFYLQSRGIPADDARRMVVRGFFAEVIGRIGVPDVEERLLAKIDAELVKSSM
ncbi:MAG: Fe-S cluster assembly protein SufD [Sporichthyaceae bacterium]